MRLHTLSALTLSLLAFLLTLAVGVTCRPVPACASGGGVDIHHISRPASLISRRSQALCLQDEDDNNDVALAEEPESPTSPSWQRSFSDQHPEKISHDDDKNEQDYEQPVLKIRSAHTHSNTKLKKHGVHHLDVGEHMTKFDKVHHSLHFSHQSSHGAKSIQGSAVNKWAQIAVNSVGGRKKVLDQSKISALTGHGLGRIKGYPKIGSGFAKSDPQDPVPKDHIAYHGMLKPTRSERKGKGVAKPDPKRKYPSPTRVIIHRHPDDKSWQVKTSFHDPSKPIPSGSIAHPFTEMKGHHV